MKEDYTLIEESKLATYNKAVSTLLDIIHEYYSGKTPGDIYQSVEQILVKGDYIKPEVERGEQPCRLPKKDYYEKEV